MPRTTIEFRGEEQTIVYEIGQPEPDVGIMSTYVSDWYFADVKGGYPQDLTPAEQKAIERELDELPLEEEHDDYDRAW